MLHNGDVVTFGNPYPIVTRRRNKGKTVHVSRQMLEFMIGSGEKQNDWAGILGISPSSVRNTCRYFELPWKKIGIKRRKVKASIFNFGLSFDLDPDFDTFDSSDVGALLDVENVETRIDVMPTSGVSVPLEKLTTFENALHPAPMLDTYFAVSALGGSYALPALWL